MPQRTDIHKILIIGSGPIVIGQACEFDYSGTQACKALRSLGYEIVLVNSNPATIMTDPEMADITYIEPLNVKRLEQIIAKERPDGLLPNLGGQSGLNLCSELYKEGILDKYNVKVIGVQVDAIERGEDRIEFKNTMNMLGIEMARSEVAYSVEQALPNEMQCSMSFYDAQACGLPVVSEQNNVNEQRCSHHNGANFIPGSVDDFRDKIEWFAGMSIEERKQYSENARRFIEDGYDYADIARQYTDYLKKAVEDYKRKKGKN